MLGNYIQLSNGLKCPQMGFGTFMSANDDCYNSVKHAIDAGYRHIDTAFMYFNEDQVGRAIKEKISEGVVKREDLFITTKLGATEWRNVAGSLSASLKLLQLDYVDLFLVHSPGGLRSPKNRIQSLGDYIKYTQESKNFTKDEKYEDMDYVDLWKSMEEVVGLGLSKSIGVSNMNAFQINRLVNNCNIKPAMNQIEVHPFHAQFEMVKLCEKFGIKITAYGPIGAPGRPATQEAGLPVLMEDPIVTTLAKQHTKTPAQILIRFAIQRGIVVIPKSVKKDRVYENGAVFDFELSKDDMEMLYGINKDQRFFPLSFHDHKYYPFQDNYTE